MGLKAVVLLSGGIDSSTTLAIAKKKGFLVYSMSFDYGQRHALELGKARTIADLFKVEKHIVIKLNLRAFGGSALTDTIPVPKDRNEEAIF